MSLQWTVSASTDLKAAINFIAQDSLSAALRQLDEIEEQTDRLAEYPMLGRAGRVKGTRELVVNRTPFIVVYRIKGEMIQILRVLHGAQQSP
ncbi:MAG: type II toxin-antitoxin system RelE/ParE family toxin [Methylococcaceae bacterium]